MHCIDQAQCNAARLSIALEVTHASLGSWLRTFISRECFLLQNRCSNCTTFVIERRLMRMIASLDAYLCNACVMCVPRFAACSFDIDRSSLIAQTKAMRSLLLTKGDLNARTQDERGVV
jgi:hypothetical protein